MVYGIALGSNLGDRLGQLTRGVQALIEMLPAARLLAAAPVFETAPVDCPPGSPSFFNSVVEIECPQTHEVVHAAMQQVERELGRAAVRERNSPRPLDLDMLYAGDQVIHTATLEVPHPRLHQRRFVLTPLAAIRPELVLPGQTLTIQELLAGLDDDPAAVTQVGCLAL